mgnify:CR=1 FL=1
MIDMIESEETANRVGKYLKRHALRGNNPLQFTIEELAEQLDMLKRKLVWDWDVRLGSSEKQF